MKIKTCSICNLEKELSEFHKNKRSKFGVHSICKICKRDNLRKIKPIVKLGFKICSKCKIEKPLNEFTNLYSNSPKKHSSCKSCAKIYRDININKIRTYGLKTKYKITIDQYNQMLETQNGVCAICGKKENHTNQYGLIRLSVDHNHITGKVRGLLCAKCNKVLGLINDNILISKNITLYLTKEK